MMKPHNILYTSLSGQMLGGGQRSLLLLLERLDRTKFNPFLVCPSEGDLTEKAGELGIETRILKMGGVKSLNIFATAAVVFKLKNLIRRKDIQLVHTDSPRHAFYAGLSARMTRTPLVWHARVSNPEKKSFEKFLFNHADKIIAVSEAASQRYHGFERFDEKAIVIYNGVDLSEFGPKPIDRKLKQKFKVEDDQLLVGTLGQLIPGKGQEVFLKAAAQITAHASNVIFMIVGDGNHTYRRRLEELRTDLGLSRKVVFTGFRKDIPRIMNALDIVVLPSTTHLEGFSRVIIEAMASAKPVIASDSGGNPEAIEDGVTGILVPAADSDRLSASILELVQDEDKRKRMGTAGRQRAERLFSIEKNVSRIEKIYEELLCSDT